MLSLLERRKEKKKVVYLRLLNTITAPFKELPLTGSSIPTELLSEDSGFKTMISESRYIPPYLDDTQQKFITEVRYPLKEEYTISLVYSYTLLSTSTH